VEVLSLRDESSQTWINPDGTWTTQSASGPVRFQNAGGEWRNIDVTLRVLPSGEVAPVAHPSGLTFAGGAPGVVAPDAVGVEVGGRASAGSVPVVDLAPVVEDTAICLEDFGVQYC